MTTTTILSLASGYCGLEIALEGLLPDPELLFTADPDPSVSRLLRDIRPWAPNLGDVRHHPWRSMLTTGGVDVITGGYPCQPFSHAGSRNGTDDPRHIFPRVLTAVTDLRPSFVFLENVAGHRSLGGHEVVASLAGAGYRVSWDSLRASDIGACHRRERLWIMAVLPDRVAAMADWDLRPAPPPPPFGGKHLPTPKARDGHQESLAAGTRRIEEGLGGATLPTVARLLPTPLGNADARSAHNSTATRHRVPPSGIHPGDTLTDVLVPNANGVAKLLPTAQPERWGQYAAAIARHEAIHGPVPEPVQPSPTTGNPQLAPRFVEWMMMLPPGTVTGHGLTRNQELRALGNGIVPPQALAAYRRIALTMLERWG